MWFLDERKVTVHFVSSNERNDRRKNMFDKLDDLLIRFEEVLNELGEPGVTDNQENFQNLM